MRGTRVAALLSHARAAVSGWPVLRWAPPALVLTVLVLAWWLTAQRLQAQQSQLWEMARNQQAVLAASVHQRLAQLVDKGNDMAWVAADALEGSAQERLQTRRRLQGMLAGDPSVRGWAVLDAGGTRVLSAAPAAQGTPGPAADLEGRQTAWVQQQIQARQAPAGPQRGMGDATGGAPRASAEHQAVRQVWAAPLPAQALPTQAMEEARPVWVLLEIPPAPDGALPPGYLLLTTDMAQLLEASRRADLLAGTRVEVLAPDGLVLAALEGETLEPLPDGGRRPVLAQQPGVQGHAQVRLEDQQMHLASWQRSAGVPWTVAVSLPVAQLLQAHHSSSWRRWGLLLVMTAVALLATVALARMLGRQHALFQALSVADAQNQSLIGQLEQEKARALELAGSDPLTGLHNRRMFNELVASHLALARRSTKHYALLYLDLDRFKHVNDSQGHHVGDLLLQAVAQRLRSLVRSSDIMARMGGDEFAILVSAMESPGDVEQLATKLVASLSQPYEQFAEQPTLRLHTSPSVGIAFFPRDGHDVATLCRHADAAMYASKRAGRGRFTYYDPAHSPQSDRSWQLERELAYAIANDQMVLHFQPKVRLDDCRIEGLEALVRWQHPELGLIYPGDFIALAEKNGLIAELGDWVLRACCRQAAQWRQQGVEGVPIAFNVSPVQLRDTAFPTRVARCLQEYGVRASDLEMEITESCLVEPVDLAVRVLSQMQGMGMRIGLDDFGTGFSSLSQIRNLPIDTIKLDRSFVDDIRSSPEAGVLVTSIITLAHNLQLRVVAEGVELLDQLVYLKTAGCDVAQGYILSRPVPAAEAQRLLRQGVLPPARPARATEREGHTEPAATLLAPGLA